VIFPNVYGSSAENLMEARQSFREEEIVYVVVWVDIGKFDCSEHGIYLVIRVCLGDYFGTDG